MSDRVCPCESAVIEAVRTGEWPKSLQVHVCECAECADSARVTVWIGDVATRLGRNQSTPDPTYICLRAEIDKRARKERTLSAHQAALAALPGLAVGLLVAVTVVAVLKGSSAIATVVATSLSTALAETSLADMTVIGTVWLGLPLLLAATYLLVSRSLR